MMWKTGYEWTEEEKELIIDELTQRIRDLLSITLRPKVASTLGEMWEYLDPLDTKDEIVLTYKIEMCAGDVFQVLGRLRR